jgi:hypothetical protein
LFTFSASVKASSLIWGPIGVMKANLSCHLHLTTIGSLHPTSAGPDHSIITTKDKKEKQLIHFLFIQLFVTSDDHEQYL